MLREGRQKEEEEGEKPIFPDASVLIPRGGLFSICARVLRAEREDCVRVCFTLSTGAHGKENTPSFANSEGFLGVREVENSYSHPNFLHKYEKEKHLATCTKSTKLFFPHTPPFPKFPCAKCVIFQRAEKW